MVLFTGSRVDEKKRQPSITEADKAGQCLVINTTLLINVQSVL